MMDYDAKSPRTVEDSCFCKWLGGIKISGLIHGYDTITNRILKKLFENPWILGHGMPCTLNY